MYAALNGDEGERKRKWKRMNKYGKEKERDGEKRSSVRFPHGERARGRGAGTLTLDNPPLRACPRPLFHGIASELRAN